METSAIIRPNLTVLNDEQKEKIHSDSLKILSSVGVRVESEKAKRGRGIMTEYHMEEAKRLPVAGYVRPVRVLFSRR